MLNSLFGDLGLARPSASKPSDSPPNTIASDGAFTARALVESSSTELNEMGQMVDRQVRDLFVTGSPAQAIREHFALTRADAEPSARLITLFDPSGIWANAVLKNLSDAGGQPIERLNLREHVGLRTLATIQRTTLRRRADETLKIYHADVRAPGLENSEIPLALMERSHMATVIVGQMQPHSIDALLSMLHRATQLPTWHCPTLLFMLPPSAVWIANKVTGIEWPDAIRVLVLNESLTGASAVWNALLNMWNHVKTLEPRVNNAIVSLTGQLESPLPAGEFPIKLDHLSDAGTTAPTATAASTPAHNWRMSAPVPIDPHQASTVLIGLRRLDGLIGCALVDAVTGELVAGEQRDDTDFDLDRAAAGCSQMVRAHRLAARSLGLNEHIDELNMICGERQHIMRSLSHHPDHVLMALFDRRRVNVAQARLRLAEADKSLA